jgi:FG-GAP-like repeat
MACEDAGGSCVIGPPTNCSGQILSQFDCNPDRNPGGALCCVAVMDGGFPDSGANPDSGFSGDAGSPDSGVNPDSGLSPDGGSPDSGSPDSGSPDGGPAPDAGAPDGGMVGACGPVSNLDGGTTYATGSYLNIASGDLNGDGILDLVAGQFIGGGFDVFLGLPAGGLAEPTHYEGGGWAVAIGDINGDGVPDVVASTGTGFNIFLNDGQGGLGQPSSYLASSVVRAVGIGDFNGDSLPDLVVAGLDSIAGDTELLLNDGDGGFGPSIPIAGLPTAWGGMVVADLNQDGVPDIAINSNDGGGSPPLMVLLSQADGGFEATYYPVEIYLAIVTLPGRTAAPDLALSTGTSIQILNNSGTGVFTVGLNLPTPGAGAGWLTVADFNGDCIPDIVTSLFANCGEASWNLSVFYGDGDGGYQMPVSLPASGIAPAGMAPLGPVAHPRAFASGDSCGSGMTVYGDSSAQ